MDNYMGKDIHNPKLKFWGVTCSVRFLLVCECQALLFHHLNASDQIFFLYQRKHALGGTDSHLVGVVNAFKFGLDNLRAGS